MEERLEYALVKVTRHLLSAFLPQFICYPLNSYEGLNCWQDKLVHLAVRCSHCAVLIN